MKEDLERSHELSRFKPCRHQKVLGKARKTIRGSFCNFLIFYLFFIADLILTKLIKKMQFCKFDSNDKYLDSCDSMCCTEDDNIRMNCVFLPHGSMDMTFSDFRNVYNCYLMEQQAICGFCKSFLDCKRFKQWTIESRNRRIDFLYNNVYITLVRFNSQNLKYKTQCFTVDILRTEFFFR